MFCGLFKWCCGKWSVNDDYWIQAYRRERETREKAEMEARIAHLELDRFKSAFISLVNSQGSDPFHAQSFLEKDALVRDNQALRVALRYSDQCNICATKLTCPCEYQHHDYDSPTRVLPNLGRASGAESPRASGAESLRASDAESPRAPFRLAVVAVPNMV